MEEQKRREVPGLSSDFYFLSNASILQQCPLLLLVYSFLRGIFFFFFLS